MTATTWRAIKISLFSEKLKSVALRLSLLFYWKFYFLTNATIFTIVQNHLLTNSGSRCSNFHSIFHFHQMMKTVQQRKHKQIWYLYSSHDKIQHQCHLSEKHPLRYELLFDGITQGWATYGPRARSGPPRKNVWPATFF